MLIIALFLAGIAVVLLCQLLFHLAALALPFYAGMSVGLTAMERGAGPLTAIIAGLAAALVTLGLGHLVFTLVPSRLLRGAVVALFVLPAAVAGYHAAHGVMAIGTSSEPWRVAIGAIGAVAVGLAAFGRLVLPVPERGAVPSASG